MLLDRGSGKTQSTHGTSCTCPACLGLQCLERPRYFSGQLLTDTDLNSEQEYMRAKQRLHNRYLHGAGIVCGLQVSCGTSAGSVTIQSGYAIDPCGNDIIVCSPQDVNVIQRIRDCETARKRQRKSNCDPIPLPTNDNCPDRERHYCLTIFYNEQEKRLNPTLRQASATNTSNGKGCGCNGSGKKHGCGCNSSQNMSGTSQTMHTASMSQSSSSSQSNPPPISCEPTRIAEGYLFDISEVSPDYCKKAKVLLEDTLLAKVTECVTSLRAFLEKKLPDEAYRVLMSLAFTGDCDDVSSEDLYRYCCYLRQAICDLYTQDPCNTHCQTLDVLSQVVCQPPAQINANDEQATAQARTVYREQVCTTLYDLLALLVQYAQDCICQALMPPCPQPPADDRLVLACITVKNNTIVDICNFCHRHYAGSFPALYHWLSLVPITSIMAYAVEQLCCYDWLCTNTPNGQQGSALHGNLTNGLTSLLDSLDPSTNLRKEIFADNFATPRSYMAKYQQLISAVSSPAKLAELLHPETLNLTQVIDKAVGVSQLKSELATLKENANTIRDLQATIKTLRKELATLKSEVDQLKPRDKGRTSKAGAKPPTQPPPNA